MLTSSYPLTPGDWRGGFVRDRGRALMGQGFDVAVAAPRPAGDTWFPPEPRDGEPAASWLPAMLPGSAKAFHGAGLEANLVARPGSVFSLPPFLLSFAVEASSRAAFADCVVAHWVFPMGMVGAAVARLTSRPLVVVAHSGLPAAARIPPLREAVRLVLREASVIACVSESVRASVAAVAGEALADRVQFLPLGVDLAPHVRTPTAPGRTLRALFVGRLVRLKGVDVAIDAVAKSGGVDLTIIGDGPEAGALRRRASGLGERVRFLGECSQGAVRAAIQAHDVLIVPSRRGLLGREEGMPRVVVEAWACGLPVIASRTGGIPAAAEAGGTLLVEAGSALALSRALASLQDDATLRTRLSAEASQAADAWSWRVLAPRWARLIGLAIRGA